MGECLVKGRATPVSAYRLAPDDPGPQLSVVSGSDAPAVSR
jgi:hypothetical protein